MSTVRQLNPEQTLIASLKRRDKKAYGLLYDQYGSTLYGVVLKVVKSESLAEDVLQESFVKIWNKIDQYDGSKGRFFTWILNIARNTAIDHWRAAKRKQAVDIDKPGMEAATGGYEEEPGDAIDADAILDQLGEPEKNTDRHELSSGLQSVRNSKTNEHATRHCKN